MKMTRKRNNRFSETVGVGLFFLGITLFVLAFFCIIGLSVYLGFTDTEFAKHEQSMYAQFRLCAVGWWAYLMMLAGIVAGVIGRVLMR